jgi:hypothetical protein
MVDLFAAADVQYRDNGVARAAAVLATSASLWPASANAAWPLKTHTDENGYPKSVGGSGFGNPGPALEGAGEGFECADAVAAVAR